MRSGHLLQVCRERVGVGVGKSHQVGIGSEGVWDRGNVAGERDRGRK